MSLKQLAASFLEKHPYGYRVGVFALDNFDFLLPHEVDYFAFPILARALGKVKSGTILDLGANRGHSSRAFLKLLPGWRVEAFEANPLHEKRLRQILRNNPSLFHYHIAAVTDSDKGGLELYTPMFQGMAMHSAAALSKEEALSGVEGAFPALTGRFSLTATVTPTIAIDDLALNCDFIKIDIQGEELNALKGMTQTIVRCQPVILVEMNLKQQGIGDFLEKLDYVAYTYDHASGRMLKGYGTHTVQFRNQFFVARSIESVLR